MNTQQEENRLMRGDRIKVIFPIFNEADRCVAKVGDKGICTTDENSGGIVHIQLDYKHYPINYAPAKNLKKR